jgi:LPXTG-site transpeptidase (sortase) family protein
MTRRKTRTGLAKILTIMGFAFVMLTIPATVYADNAARQNNQFSDPNWQNTHHAENWNWQHNWAYQAPEYQFETTFSYDQWGRSTTSNAAAQHTQNIRRDRHAAFLPPSNGVVTGFYSGEFPTNQVNPYAPRTNNNPDASRAVEIEESPFALLPGETGVNVRAGGSHAGGFLASTSVVQSGGGNTPHGDTVGDTAPPWTNPGNQSGSGQDGFTVSHSPLEIASSFQASNQQGRITTVTPFEDGTIGRITIPALNNRVAAVRPGVDISTLENYAGHFSYTSQWDGTVALASHNRGNGGFFADIWTLRNGDRIFYETTMGVRVYEVTNISQISETDLSNLDHSHDNIIVLITCVYGRPELRWSIRAREVV